MIFQIVVGVLVLAYLIMAFFASKTWRWTHVLLLVGVFLMSLVFVGLSAMSLKTQEAWRKKHDQIVDQIARADREMAELQNGSIGDDDQPVPGLGALQAQLKRELLDRGRVWRNVQPLGMGNEGFTVDMSRWSEDPFLALRANASDDDFDDFDDPPADDAAGEGGEAGAAAAGDTNHGIGVGMILHGFLEAALKEFDPAQQAVLLGKSELLSRDPNGVARIPFQFVGSFRVMAVNNNNQITLQPILPLDESQQQIITQRLSWVFYETMPIDDHETLAGLSAEQLRRILIAPQGTPPQLYNELVEKFARDNQAAEPNDDPERTWTKVKFLTAHEIDVDVEEGRDEESLKSFDPSGRAIAKRLIQGEPTKFEEGSTALFDTETARKLIRNGTCEAVDEAPIYLRPLRDFAYSFREQSDQLLQAQRRADLLEIDSRATLEAARKANEQIAFRKEEITKLNADQRQTDREISLLRRVASSLNSKVSDQRLALSTLYRWNQQLAAEIRGFIQVAGQ